MDYYVDSSAARLLEHTRTPMLLLSARDDPICPAEGLPLAKIAASDHLIAVVTPEGGHVAW